MAPREPKETEPKETEPKEAELRLLVRRQDRPALERHPLLQAKGPPEERDELTTYFDTPRLALAEKGLSLRVRRSGQTGFQTLNSARNGCAGAASSGEWKWPLEGDTLDLARIAEIPSVADILAETGDELEPVFRTRIRRTVRCLELPSGAMIEAAFDEGEVASGAATQEVSELKLRLKQGSPGSLHRFALELHKIAPFTIGLENKAERARRLRTCETARAVESEPPRLQQDEPAAAAVRRIIAAELRHLLANLPAAAVSDIEGVHQIRIGIRRLRTVLALFGKRLDRKTTGRWEAELKRLGQVFGIARDWDVFCTETLLAAAEDERSKHWADTLRNPAEARRRAAHETVREELGQPALTELVLGMAAWTGSIETNGIRGTGKQTAQPRIADLVPGLLDRSARRVGKRSGHLRRRSVEGLHGLRKALKKLRYGVEYVRDFYPPKQARRYQKAAKRVLTLLGTANDAEVAASLAESLCKGNPAEMGPAATGIRKWSGRRAAKARRKLPKAWATFAAAPPIWQ